ncbi:MAG: anthranilate phosphoribosyltransferase [Terricaulis sp.]
MSLAALNAKLAGADLEAHEIDAAFAIIMDGAAGHEDIKRFLELSLPRMHEPAWIAGGAGALRVRMKPVAAPAGAIDVCGTGGDGAHTLNISTAVAFVVAGCGVPVAKHGNRAMSSKSGAADVLEALGVKLTGHVPTLEHCLAEAKLAFLFAQNHHPAMRHVALVRREIGKRTIFNLLGPLSNPAGVKRQLVGVFALGFVEPVATALRELGAESAIVVHGAGGLDEFSFADGQTRAISLDTRGRILEMEDMDPWALTRAFGVEIAAPGALAGGNARFNADALRALLEGRAQDSAYERAVMLNAAAALIAAGRFTAASVIDAWAAARDSIRGGAAKGILDKLITISQRAP